MNQYSIISEPIDPDRLHNNLNDPSCGAIVCFSGKVRNHNNNKEVIGITYETHIPMAENILKTIIHETSERFLIKEIRIVHRIGELKVGDVSVWIGIQAAHRSDAFKACQHAIDELKKRVPIWKKEHFRKGESQWVGEEKCLN